MLGLAPNGMQLNFEYSDFPVLIEPIYISNHKFPETK